MQNCRKIKYADKNNKSQNTTQKQKIKYAEFYKPQNTKQKQNCRKIKQSHKTLQYKVKIEQHKPYR